MQKIRKKYRTVKAVGPERTDERTYERTYESEFIGFFRSLKTSGELTSYQTIIGKLSWMGNQTMAKCSHQQNYHFLHRNLPSLPPTN